MKEKCELCQKYIYTHDYILVCSTDNNTYHAKCLKIDNDTALELQKQPNWSCHLCLRNIFPNFDDSESVDNEKNKCYSCQKIISNTRQRVTHCIFCNNKCHYNCVTKPIFACYHCNKTKLENSLSDEPDDLNLVFNDTLFNPFKDLHSEDGDNEKNRFFDDEIDEHCETVEFASKLLNDCKYYDSEHLPFSKFQGTSFYFNNIDGLQSNFLEFKNQILNTEINFDFYCFNETNLKSGILHDFEIENYNSEFHYGIQGKNKGSGLAIYYRKNLKFNITKSLTMRNEYFECLGGKLKCEIGNVNVLVFYRFNYNKSIDTLFELISDILVKLDDTPTIIMGDFNYNVLKHQEINIINRYVDTFICSGFIPLISKPTHFKGEAATSLDQIWTNIISSTTTSGVINNSASAHYPVFACIPTSAESLIDDTEEGINTIQKHNISLDNIENFDKKLHSIEVDDFKLNYNIERNSCKEQFSSYYSDIKSTYDDCFKEETEIKSKRNFHDKPWISLAIAKSCKIKNKLHRKTIRRRNKHDYHEVKGYYNIYRAKLRDIIRLAQSNYYRKRFVNCKGDIKNVGGLSTKCKKRTVNYHSQNI